MKRLAIATAAITMMAAPAMAQYVYGPAGEVHVQAGPYAFGSSVYAPTHGYTYGYSAPAYGYAAPAPGFGFVGVYDRNLDIATEPDPQIRRELRREQTLNLDQRP
jgi:hypothetical protein